MGCLKFDELQNSGIGIPMMLFLILLLLAILVLNFFYWIVLRMSGIILPQSLKLIIYCLLTTVIAHIISTCVLLPNYIFLFSRDIWNLDEDICKSVAIIEILYRNGVTAILLLCILDRFMKQKFQSIYKKLNRKSFYIGLAIVLAWAAVVIISLPTLASISNNNEWADAGCTSTKYTRGICGSLVDSSMPVYQFLAMWFLPTIIGAVLLVMIWKENRNTPEAIILRTVSGNSQNNQDIPESKESFEDEFYEEDDMFYNPVFSKYGCNSYQESNLDLISNLPPATTRFSTLPHLENAARIHLLRLQLESRTSNRGEDGKITPSMEAWPGGVDIEDMYPCSSQASESLQRPDTPGACNMSIRSPPPRYKSPPLGFRTDLGFVNHHGVDFHDTMGKSPCQGYEEKILKCLKTDRIVSPTKSLGEKQNVNKRQHQRHARLRQKWKRRSLKKLSTLPPIRGSEDSSTVSTEQDGEEVMPDHTGPYCEKESFKLIAGNYVIFLAATLPFEMASMIVSTCSSCQVSVTLWMILKSMISFAAVLAPIFSCWQHPALRHTAKFIFQIVKSKRACKGT